MAVELPPEYYRYLEPEIYSRLVEGYASDEMWNVLSRTSDISQAIEIAKVLPELVERLPDLADVLEKKPFIDWYVEVSDLVSDLVNRADTLKSVADQLVGVVVERFFNLVGDLVGVHDNLMWYADTETVTAAYSLFERYGDILDVTADLHDIRADLVELDRDLYELREPLKRLGEREEEITGTTDFIMSTTPGGRSRWDILQTYLSDSWFTDIDSLLGEKGDIDRLVDRTSEILGLVDIKSDLDDLSGRRDDILGLVDEKPDLDDLSERAAYIRGFIDGMRSVAEREGIGFSTVVDRMRWYADGGVQYSLWDVLEKKSGYDLLYGIREELSAIEEDLYGIRGTLVSLSNMEPDISTLVGDKDNLHWLASSDVVGVIDNLLSGILPTIQEDALFNKNVHILGPSP